MNMFKKNGGFTLVELIVVIAILAILAGVAVPAYTGYINRANEAADLAVCDAVKTAVFAAYAMEGQNPPETITVADGAISAPTELYDIADFYDVSTIDLNAASATWTATSGEWEFTPAS